MTERKYVDETTIEALLTRIEEIETKMTSVENCYPIGSIYVTTLAGNPSTLLGFGGWQQIQDRFLLAAGSSYAAGATGGAATHKLTIDEMPSHTHAPTTKTPGTDTYNQYAFTINRHYSSNSTQRFKVNSGSGYTVMGANINANDYGGNADIEQSLETAPTGGSKAHSIMPPYLVVYVWKRTS